MLDVVCLGNVTIDDVVLADGATHMGCLGGDTIYAALSARLWSDAVEIVAPVGYDYPLEYRARLAAFGLGGRGMPGRDVPTRRNWAIYERDGRRTWIVRTDKADFRTLSPVTADVPAEFLSTRSFLILAMDLACQEDLVAGLKADGVLIALDPKEDDVAGNEHRILKMLEGVDVFLPSEIEVARLLGHLDHRRAARQLAQRGCKVVAIKLGANGALLYDARSDRYTALPAAPADVVDTTGAGDAFSGGFMAAYARTGDLERAGMAGTVSASFAAEAFGSARLFRVTETEARQRLERLSPIEERSGA